MAKVGFIGLGNMGGHMANNLLKAGHSMKAFDLMQDALDRAVANGATAAKSASDAGRDVDVVITMLPAGKHVRSVYAEPGGIIEVAAPGTLLIDSSTIDVQSARDVSAAAAKKGLDMVDAPVSGGVGGAQAGTLTFMVGGSQDAFNRAKPFLDIMGKNIFYAGGPGNGQAAKICNNMLLGIGMIGTSEAFNLAEKLGLDAKTFFDISSTASGQCWSMTSYCPAPGPVPTSPANNDYKPGFAVDMMLKDLRLAKEAAESVGAETPLGHDSEALYGKLSASGHGGLDFSGIIKMLAGKL
ncbi:MAG: 3-hydroxyisobutyrate dehydrogenase [Alphaproteobacteria bacterium]|nr:3-hydroxyisobutyrate dehydrogenase [Alphaproteobacteria bacterium]